MIKNCAFCEGLKFHVSVILRRTPLTRLSPAGLPVIIIIINIINIIIIMAHLISTAFIITVQGI